EEDGSKTSKKKKKPRKPSTAEKPKNQRYRKKDISSEENRRTEDELSQKFKTSVFVGVESKNVNGNVKRSGESECFSPELGITVDRENGDEDVPSPEVDLPIEWNEGPSPEVRPTCEWNEGPSPELGLPI